MIKTEFKAVIGKNFGDEGKGLTTDFLCLNGAKNLVVRANGGAQSGHTVETRTKRFVFHELSSGSFRHADTYWAETYHPDLYKLPEEIEDFKAQAGFVPKIFASKNAGITTILDVVLNMALETNRGTNRHGSCGMGIYETVLREESGNKISIEDVLRLGHEGLEKRLFEIRDNYTFKRFKEEHISLDSSFEYTDLLNDDNVIKNYAKAVRENISLIEVVDSEKEFFEQYDQVIFENGQGLLLDSEREEFYPNVTGSRTGLYNINRILSSVDAKLSEVIYVSRSYVTRHGAGLLPCECDVKAISESIKDETNLPNEWQGTLRYGLHESTHKFIEPVKEDLEELSYKPKVSLLLTHLNETDGDVLFKEKRVPADKLFLEKEIKDTFDKIYLSSDRFSENIKG